MFMLYNPDLDIRSYFFCEVDLTTMVFVYAIGTVHIIVDIMDHTIHWQFSHIEGILIDLF